MTSSRARTAQVRLRYRPASDVLSGDIELGMLAAGDPATESADADTHLRWFPVLGDGEVLAGFHLVHASARSLTALPTALARLVPHLIERGAAELVTCSTPLHRAELRIDSSVRLPVIHLARPSPPGHAPAEWLVGASDIARTADAVSVLAHTLSTTASRLAEPHQAPTVALATAVRELSSVVAQSHGRTAPGTSAAARAAVTSQVPLEPHERHELLAALTDVDDTRSWPAVWALVDDLCASLLHSPALG